MPAWPTIRVGDNARKGFASPEDIEAVIAHLAEHAKPIVGFLYVTGWRTGEVLALTWARVDFETGTVRLDAGESKTGKARTFPFAGLSSLAKLLREQRRQAKAFEREQGKIVPHVFHLNGEPIDSIRTTWRTAVRKAGLPGLTPHDMRRSAARNLVRAGVPERVVMDLCGWRTRAMFDRYNITAVDDLRDGVARLGRFFEQRKARKAAEESA